MALTKIATDLINDAAVTAAKMASSLDLSAKTLTLSAAQRAAPYIELRDEKADNTAGGTFTQDAWRTRVLQTEHADTDSLTSISSNQFALPAGTYLAEIEAPAYQVGAHQARLQNITDGATALLGQTARSGSSDNMITNARVTGRFTIAGTKTFEVQHYCKTTAATNGFGAPANIGLGEIYTVARFWKVG